MAESRGRRARVARILGRPRQNGGQPLTVGELRAALPERNRSRRTRTRDSDSSAEDTRAPVSGLPMAPRGLFPQRRGSDNAPMGSSGLRDLLESLSEGPRRSRGGRRSSRVGRGEAEAIEAGKPRSAVSYEFAEKSSGESRRPRRERPRVTARQRRIRARRRRERAEARAERAERRRSRSERQSREGQSSVGPMRRAYSAPLPFRRGESSRGDSTRGPLREAFAATTPMQSQSDRVPDSIRRRPRDRAAELRGMTVTPRRRSGRSRRTSRTMLPGY